MTEVKKETRTWAEISKEQQAQAICSHDAPGQQPGTPCIRCKKVLPGAKPEAPAPAKA